MLLHSASNAEAVARLGGIFLDRFYYVATTQATVHQSQS